MKIYSIALSALFAAVAPANANEWTAQITPYVWGTGLGGDLTPFTGAPSLSIDKSLSDVLEDLDAAFFLSAYARKDRFVVLGDLSMSSSTRDDYIAPGLPASGKVKQQSVTLLGGYRAVEQDDMKIDLLVGARAWRIDADISVAGGAIHRSSRKEFVDPILAARLHFNLTPQWSAMYYFDVGGFGAGSEQTSQIVATANYQVNESVFLSAGYRHLKVDYRNNGTKIDLVMSGPLLGATWRF